MKLFNWNKVQAVIFLGLMVFTKSVLSEEILFKELSKRYTLWHIDYKVNEDFTVESLLTLQEKALTEDEAKSLKKYSFSYSTSIEHGDVVDAYTVKSDGRRIKVPKDNYQVTVNKGAKKGGPLFSDRTRVSIVFPDFVVGDSRYVKVKRVEREPMFPGHFSLSSYFYREVAYDDVRVSIDAPSTLKFSYDVRGMSEDVSTLNGRKIITLTYKNIKPLKNQRKDFSVWSWEEESGFAMSTFKDYQSIAVAYGERAKPKALPNPRIERLAKKIVGGEMDAREKARKLYDWTALNITYAGNCIGIGAVVPHDTDFILDNKMGDCKDHATLLEALLTSVGIKSTQALINSGGSYYLPKIPMVSSVNHVINYIPAFDKFVDSTNADMPFELLGHQILGKPVLLVDGFKDGMRTPSLQSSDSQQVVNATMSIQPDGSVKGKTDVALQGYPAVSVRAFWRNIKEEREADWLESMFSSQDEKGVGSVVKDDPEPLLDQFSYSFDFRKPNFILSEGAGGLYVGSLGYSPLGIYSFLSSTNEEYGDYEVQCGNGYSIERVQYRFPENIRILAQPKSFTVSASSLTYRAVYELEGRILNVLREFKDESPANICSSALMNQQRDVIKQISKNMRSQVVYQYIDE